VGRSKNNPFSHAVVFLHPKVEGEFLVEGLEFLEQAIEFTPARIATA
jgi:hypothetical protein